MLDVIDYDCPTKDHWRRTVWNVVERTAPNKYEALILYLPGEQALDRITAAKRKYKDHCLIAVERNRTIVRKLRKTGVNCIHGTLESVMESWPDSRPVDFVLADLQTNSQSTAAEIFGSYTGKRAFHKAGLMLNMQRGRERSQDMVMIGQVGVMHRAYAAWVSFVESIADHFTNSENHKVISTNPKKDMAVVWYPPITCAKKQFEFDQFIEVFDMKFKVQQLSYRAETAITTMDSVVITRRRPENPEKMGKAEINLKMTRKIAAALAVRTTRMKEVLR